MIVRCNGIWDNGIFGMHGTQLSYGNNGDAHNQCLGFPAPPAADVPAPAGDDGATNIAHPGITPAAENGSSDVYGIHDSLQRPDRGDQAHAPVKKRRLSFKTPDPSMPVFDIFDKDGVKFTVKSRFLTCKHCRGEIQTGHMQLH